MRSPHRGLGISSAGFTSLTGWLPTNALVLTTGSPFLRRLLDLYRYNSWLLRCSHYAEGHVVCQSESARKLL